MSDEAIIENEVTEETNQESEENVNEEVSEEIVTPTEEMTPSEIKEVIKKLKLKVDGKEIEEELPFEIPNDPKAIDWITKQLQLAKVSGSRMKEAAELKKAYTSDVSRLKENPWQVLSELGLNPDDLAEQRIQQRIDELSKSPEQLEREKIQKELEDARSALKKQAEEKEQLEMEKLENEAAVQLDKDITEALSSTTSLPKSPFVIKRIADTMAWAMRNGYKDITAKDVAPIVEKEVRGELQKLMDELPEQVLEELVGKKNIERLRKNRLASKPATNPLTSIKETATKAPQAPAKKLTLREFMKSNLAK